MPASVPIVDRLDRADPGLVLAASTCDRLALRGFHLLPPLLGPTWRWMRRIDRHGETLGPLMLNIATLARIASAGEDPVGGPCAGQ